MSSQDIKRGESNEITRKYFDHLLIEMRHMDNVLPQTGIELFGCKVDTPITMAAFSHLKNKEMDGMVELAKAAAACNAINMVGMGDEDELDCVMATGAPTIKIIKPYADRQRIEKKLSYAKAAGVLAVGIDIDHSFGHDGNYDNVFGNPMMPLTMEELRHYVQISGLPFLIKGVLSVADALKCLDAGVSGIIVSHHHGIIPYAVPPIMVLPEIVKAVAGRMKIIVDCGIADGSDAFKALALGAEAVCVGRAILPSMHAEGAAGAEGYLRQMTTQLRGIMARTGFATPADIEASVLHYYNP